MKSQKVVLFGCDTGRGVSTALQTILDPHFDLLFQEHDWRTTEGEASSSSVQLTRCIQQANPNLVFLVHSNNQLARELLESVQSLKVPVIVVTEACDADEMFELLKAGCTDFILPPLNAANVLPRAWRILTPNSAWPVDQLKGATQPETAPGDPAQSHPTPEMNEPQEREPGLKQLIGRNPAFVTQVQNIPTIARCEANVLIVGETGTGKELYARGIHYCSARAGRPFMPVNCGAIPVDLVENELFGHERGAFTSALNLQTGLIAEANGGTLFLDEIDCLPIMAQVKLLRFLQEKEYRPLGSSRMRQANVRIIAASNLDLQEAVGNGKVRQDLFYRLNVISLTLPPLRDRREDIPLLAHHFLEKYSTEFNKQTLDFGPEAINSLMAYNWPGNIRELEHVVERAIVLCEGPIIRPGDLAISSSQPSAGGESLRQAKAKEIARFEKNYIQGLLSACGGNITKAARVAQKNRRAFWQLIQKYEINVSSFKSRLTQKSGHSQASP